MNKKNIRITKSKIIYCKLNGSNVVYILKNIKEKIATLNLNEKVLLVNIDEIEILKDYKPKKEIIQKASYSFTPCTENRQENEDSSELMLRLLTVDEALPLLDKFIDNAVILKLPQVKVIHGKKGGVIRKAVHEYLKSNKFVESYTYAEYYDGSYGATIAKMKR